MRKNNQLYYTPRAEKIMIQNYDSLDHCRLALGLVTPHSKVLSIGCGRGREVSFLCSIGCEVTAIDINEEYLKESRNIESRAYYILGDFLATRFSKDKTFDFILILWNTINAFEGFDNRELVIVKSEKLLNRGGKIILTTKRFLKGFFPINDYTIASFEANGIFKNWFHETHLSVERKMIDGVWLIVATKQ